MELEYLYESVIGVLISIWSCTFTMFGVTVSIGSIVIFAVLAGIAISFLRG